VKRASASAWLAKPVSTALPRQLTPWALVIALVAPCACSDPSPAPNCPGVGAPALLELSDLTPALGASVVNDAIVHSFTVEGDVSFDGVASDALSYPRVHTAGTADPALAFEHVPASDLTHFTSVAVTWANAPAHVEITTPLVFETDEGCAYQLPAPLFSYDVTAP
jgi:hypothetical protein